jgi:hypothetical protein
VDGPILTRTLLIALPPQPPWAVALEVLEVAAPEWVLPPPLDGWLVAAV